MATSTPPTAVNSSPTSLTIETRNQKTLPISLLQTILKPFRPHLIKPRKVFPAGSPQLTIHKSTYKSCNVTERKVANIYLYDMTPKPSSSSPSSNQINGKGVKNRHIYYFAGGGWQMPPSPEHWKLCANLCTQLGPAITVTIISYPLAPNSAAKDSLPALCALYPDLFSPYTNNTETEVSFAGDSAGGNVALALVLKMLREKPNAPAPVKVLLICPAVDLRPQPHSSSSSVSSALKTADAIDPLLGIAFTNSTAETWSLGSDAVDPDISPLLADPGILANRGTMVYGITAGADVLAPPAIAFAEACREKGVQGRWMHWEGLMHCFVLAGCYGIREGKEGVEWLIEALKE